MALLTVAALTVTLAVLLLPGGGGGTGAAPGAKAKGHVVRRHVAQSIPAIEAGLLPWQLQAPVSREVVLPGATAGSLLVGGGLTAGGNSASGVYRLATATGALTLVGDLPQATHDAAGAMLNGIGLVFGGGAATPSGGTQAFGGTGAPRSLVPLPQARADAAAVSVGGTAYVVGGYDGPSFDPEVLATSDGRTYRPVAALPVPVRYPAVAALKGLIYVFGGQAKDGSSVDTVQVVDPGAGTAKVLGHLPLGLSAAAAGVLGGTIYIAGGTSGPSGSPPVKDIFAFDPAHSSFVRAGSLPVAVANAGAAVSGRSLYIVGGETSGAAPTADVQVLKPNLAFGVAGAPGAGSPYFGDHLLIADRGNDRLLLLDDTGNVVWRYPSNTAPPPPGGFYFPDDAFFMRHGTAIISNQEENDTVVEIAYPSGRIIFSYGHPHLAGSSPGYLNNPDDAYLLPNGDITVADPVNCRVIVLDPATKTIVHQIGTVGSCVHNPPTNLGSPNGDTPLADGNLLISEINGSWVDEYTTSGRLVWTVTLPIGYPSDAQQIGPDRYLVADYESPGAIVEFNRAGTVLYRYQPSSGPGRLDHPSLVELLPSGVFLLNDDYNDRVAAFDPSTGALVWQYGVTGTPGTAAGLLNTPDGFDILGPNGTAPTHPATG